MSAFGGKADIAPASQNVRLRPDMPVQERQHETDPGQRFRTGMLLICAGSSHRFNSLHLFNLCHAFDNPDVSYAL